MSEFESIKAIWNPPKRVKRTSLVTEINFISLVNLLVVLPVAPSSPSSSGCQPAVWPTEYFPGVFTSAMDSLLPW